MNPETLVTLNQKVRTLNSKDGETNVGGLVRTSSGWICGDNGSLYHRKENRWEPEDFGAPIEFVTSR